MYEHIEAFIVWLGEVSPHTKKTYRSDLRQFEKWFRETYGRAVNIDDLAPVIVEAYKTDLMGRMRASTATQAPSSVSTRSRTPSLSSSCDV